MNNNQQSTMLRGFSACFNWRWNMLEYTNKCYCAPLPVTASKCYRAPLPVTASKCYRAPLPVTASKCYCTSLPVTASVTVLPCLLLPISHFNFNLSLSQKYLRTPCLLLPRTFRHCDCNRLWLSSFVQFALNSDTVRD